VRTRKIGLAVLLLAVFASTAFAPPSRRGDRRRPDSRPSRRRPRRRQAGGLTIGQEAPDFELPILVEKTGDDGKKVAVVTTEKIKLSSYLHKKIVCIFMSSYT